MRKLILLYCLFIFKTLLHSQPGINNPENNNLFQMPIQENFNYEFPFPTLKSMSSGSILDSIVSYQIYKNASEHLETVRYLYTYNTNNELVIEEYSSDAGHMFIIETDSFIYNSNNKIERIEYNYDFTFDLNSIDFTLRKELVQRQTYNKNGFLIRKDICNSYDMYDSRKDSFSYYEDGSLKTYIKSFSFGEDTSTIKEMYVYPDTTKNVKVTITLSWDESDSIWVNYKKNVININHNGYRTLWTDYFWDKEKNTWQEFVKEEITYGQQNGVLYKIFYAYNSIDNSWAVKRKIEFEYNTNGDIKEIYYYSPHEFYETWNLDKKDMYYYSDKITNIDQNLFTAHNIKAYPNPAKNWLTIYSEPYISVKYSIFNIHGQLVQSGELDRIPENKIDISCFESGVYIIQIQIENIGNQLIKFIKR